MIIIVKPNGETQELKVLPAIVDAPLSLVRLAIRR
jgi:hypothetical protein